MRKRFHGFGGASPFFHWFNGPLAGSLTGSHGKALEPMLEIPARDFSGPTHVNDRDLKSCEGAVPIGSQIRVITGIGGRPNQKQYDLQSLDFTAPDLTEED